jgi:hypothetical protein
MKDGERKHGGKAKVYSIRKRQTSAKVFFVRKFFPDTKDKPEPEVGTNPQTRLKPIHKARKSKPEIVLSTAKKDVAIIEPKTGSKRQTKFMEERKSKKQKVSPSIAENNNF